MTPEFEIQDIANPYVHHTQKALVSSLKLFLVEYLNCHDRGVLHKAVNDKSVDEQTWEVRAIHVEAFVPVWIESLLHHTRRMSLFRIYSDHCERIRKSENIPLR